MAATKLRRTYILRRHLPTSITGGHKQTTTLEPAMDKNDSKFTVILGALAVFVAVCILAFLVWGT